MPAPIKKLDAFDRRFVAEYIVDLNATAACRRAGAEGDDHAVNTRAHRMMKRVKVAEAINRALDARIKRTEATADDVLREVRAIATADTNEIMQVRRGCCRHCYGDGFKKQYIDEAELNRARNAYFLTDESLVDEFSHGGTGFDMREEPNEECPECGGEGSAYVHVNDTRLLSPAARALFAGAKQTKDGIEVKLHDKSKHLELLMRHHGLLNDKLVVTGDLGARILKARKRVGGQ